MYVLTLHSAVCECKQVLGLRSVSCGLDVGSRSHGSDGNRSKLDPDLGAQCLQPFDNARFPRCAVACSAGERPQRPQQIDQMRPLAKNYLATALHSLHDIKLVPHQVAQLRTLARVAEPAGIERVQL